MKIKVSIILIAILLLGGVLFLKISDQNTTLLTPGSEQDKKISPTPTLTPFPTITIDKNSNLKEEVKKLTPEDFSSDFTDLKSF